MAYTKRETHHLDSLMNAIADGSLFLVKRLLSGSLRETTIDEVVAIGEEKLSPLMYAIQWCPIVHNESDNRYQIMLAILEECSNLRLQNEASLQAINMAIYRGHGHVIQALLTKDDSLLTQSNRRHPPLRSILYGIKNALERAVDFERYTSIFEQIIAAQPESVNTPWEVNQKSVYPIVFSFSNLPNAVTTLLLKKGADPQPIRSTWKSDGLGLHDDEESQATLRICIAKALLNKQLQAYIDRIDRYGSDDSKFRFFTFPLFKTSRGLNREINYKLAKQLQLELNLDDKNTSIRNIFDLVDDKRKTIITVEGYSTREGYRAVQKIGSSELREIVKAGILAGEERISDEQFLVNAQGGRPSY